MPSGLIDQPRGGEHDAANTQDSARVKDGPNGGQIRRDGRPRILITPANAGHSSHVKHDQGPTFAGQVLRNALPGPGVEHISRNAHDFGWRSLGLPHNTKNATPTTR